MIKTKLGYSKKLGQEPERSDPPESKSRPTSCLIQAKANQRQSGARIIPRRRKREEHSAKIGKLSIAALSTMMTGTWCNVTAKAASFGNIVVVAILIPIEPSSEQRNTTAKTVLPSNLKALTTPIWASIRQLSCQFESWKEQILG